MCRDIKEKANICKSSSNQTSHAKATLTHPLKGLVCSPPFGVRTVDPKGVAKLLDGLNVHKAPGPDGLNARVLKECSNEISPILALIFNESLARSDVPESGRLTIPAKTGASTISAIKITLEIILQLKRGVE